MCVYGVGVCVHIMLVCMYMCMLVSLCVYQMFYVFFCCLSRSQGADVNSECKHGTTPLLWAIASVKTEAIHALVMRGANIHHSSPAHQSMTSLEDRSLIPCHSLLAAARVGSVETLRFLINMGVKVCALLGTNHVVTLFMTELH